MCFYAQGRIKWKRFCLAENRWFLDPAVGEGEMQPPLLQNETGHGPVNLLKQNQSKIHQCLCTHPGHLLPKEEECQRTRA